MLYSKVYLDSLGYELPPDLVTSYDLERQLAPVYKALHLQEGQLEALTGIRQRRFWEPGFPMWEGALRAAQKALEESSIPKSSIGMLIYGGVCRDNLEPATACAIADGLGLSNHAIIYDISNACIGILNGMVQIANAIELGQIEAGLVVACESSRQIVDFTIERLLDAKDMLLFKETIATLTGGSGAAAVLLTSEKLAARGHQLLGGAIKNAVSHHKLCTWGPDTGIPATRPHIMKTDSVGVLQNGVPLGVETFKELKKTLGWSNSMPDKIICHQVGATHQETILKGIGVPIEKDFSTYKFLGNIGTVSLPLTAAIAFERGFLAKNDLVGFLGIGSGLNCLMLGLKW